MKLLKWLKENSMWVLNEQGGGGGTKIEAAPTTPAPNPADTAQAQYEARLKYDPLVAAQTMGIQQQYMPQQTALEASLAQQYMPQLSQTLTDIQKQQMPQLQALQAQLYPQQTQVLEAGAGQALQGLQAPQAGQLQQQGLQQVLQNLQQPQSALQQALSQQAMAGLTNTGVSPEQQAAIDAIRGRQITEMERGIRGSAQMGGGLFGGRRELREDTSRQQMGQQFAQQDVADYLARQQQAQQFGLQTTGQGQQAQQQSIQNAFAAQQQLMQQAQPFLNILYPQAATQQAQVSPFSFQSAVPDANTLYNAYFQASQPQYYSQTENANPLWGLAGSVLGGAAGGFGAGAGASMFAKK